jgi:hypothetical protein
MDFIFCIYSCKKNFEKAEFLYHLIKDKLLSCKFYIVYGDNTINTDFEIKDNKYLVLNCGDNYEHLSIKTISLLSTVEKIHPNVKGVFKCDDDILPNKRKLKELIEYISCNNIPYLGFVVNIPEDIYVSDNYHGTDPNYFKPLLVHGCQYATGPIYYLSMDTIHTFNKIPILKEILKHPIHYLFEDNMVGHLLSKENIFPINWNIYSNHIELFYNNCSIQNIRNRIKPLFIRMHGGLGNQLFQVSAGYELARKYKMHLVLFYNENYSSSMTHITDLNEFFSSIFQDFNFISSKHVDFLEVVIYNEKRCFDYDPNIIQETSSYFINGYFQHTKYLDTYRNEFLSLLSNSVICEKLTKKYPLLPYSYFIHVRRGDYLNIPIYHFDTDSYFKDAILHIINKEQNLKTHFFIVSDDIEFCKNYLIFKNIEKTFIEGMNTLDTFYFMSLCHKGGICSNSTFSGWASALNPNPNKEVIMPKNWIQVDYPYQIPFYPTITF